MPVLAACSICFLQTINYLEVQKYLFGINGLKSKSFKELNAPYEHRLDNLGVEMAEVSAGEILQVLVGLHDVHEAVCVDWTLFSICTAPLIKASC